MEENQRRKKEMRAKKLLPLILTILLFASLSPIVFADITGNSEGSAEVSSAVPTITSPKLYDDGNNKNNTAVSVNTELHHNFTISDSNTLADLHNVTVIIYDSTGSTWDDSDAEIDHYTFTWVESTDTWSCVGPSAGFINTGNCIDPGTGSSSTSFEFQLAFDLSKCATYRSDTTVWIANVTVWDDSANTDTDTTICFGVASYKEMVSIDGSHSWAGLVPGTNDNDIDDPADHKIDITVLSNSQYKIQAKANQSALISGSDEIGIGNVTIYGSDTVGSSVSLTTNYADVGGLTSQSATTQEASPAAHELWLWIDVPNGTPAGTYTYQLNAQVTDQA